MSARESVQEEGKSLPDEQAIPHQPTVEDLNKHKFIPHVIHFERSHLSKNSAYKLWELIQYQQSLKPEEQFEIMLEDCFYEPTNGGQEIVDLSVGASLGYLNLRGFFRPERSNKVSRFAEILDDLNVKTA